MTVTTGGHLGTPYRVAAGVLVGLPPESDAPALPGR